MKNDFDKIDEALNTTSEIVDVTPVKKEKEKPDRLTKDDGAKFKGDSSNKLQESSQKQTLPKKEQRRALFQQTRKRSS